MPAVNLTINCVAFFFALFPLYPNSRRACPDSIVHTLQYFLRGYNLTKTKQSWKMACGKKRETEAKKINKLFNRNPLILCTTQYHHLPRCQIVYNKSGLIRHHRVCKSEDNPWHFHHPPPFCYLVCTRLAHFLLQPLLLDKIYQTTVHHTWKTMSPSLPGHWGIRSIFQSETRVRHILKTLFDLLIFDATILLPQPP